MLYLALIWLLLAIVAGVVGFGGMAGAFAGFVQIVFFLALGLMILCLIVGLVRRA